MSLFLSLVCHGSNIAGAAAPGQRQNRLRGGFKTIPQSDAARQVDADAPPDHSPRSQM